MTDAQPQFTLTLAWNDVVKKWRLVYTVKIGRSSGVHWRWIETCSPVDAAGASLIADAVRVEMLSWLF